MQVMIKSVVYSGQSFFDIVIETTGNIDNAVEMALLNKMCITDDVIVGSELLISTITNKAVASFFDENNRPATKIISKINETVEVFGFPQIFPLQF